MNNVKINKNIKYLSDTERRRYHRLINSSMEHTDASMEELAELDAKATRMAERKQAIANKRIWED